MQHKLSTTSKETEKNVGKSTNFFSRVRTINEFTMLARKGHLFSSFDKALDIRQKKKKKTSMFRGRYVFDFVRMYMSTCRE